MQQQQTFCKQVCPWATRQLKQASTWRGLAVLAGALGIFGSPEHANAIIGAIGTVLGAVDVLKDDSKQ